MSRPKLPEQKQQIAARVSPKIKAAIQVMAKSERRTESQVIEMLLEGSPTLTIYMQANGSKRPKN